MADLKNAFCKEGRAARDKFDSFQGGKLARILGANFFFRSGIKVYLFLDVYVIGSP